MSNNQPDYKNIKLAYGDEDPKQKFRNFVKSKGMRYTDQRDVIVDAFLSTTEHVSAQQLFDMVREKHPEIGYATVSRTLKLMVDSGISWVVEFNDGIRRFDHKYGCMRHDHIICVKCNSCIEVYDKEMEDFKTQLAEQFGFQTQYSKMDIFGLCPKCRKKEEDEKN